MTTLSVTFVLEGTDLVITNTPSDSGFWIPENGVGVVDQDLFRTYAPKSAYVRAPLLAAIEEVSAVPLTIYARAASSSALQALRAQLKAAAGQWSYDLIVTVDSVATTYSAEISLPVWQLSTDSGAVAAHMDRCQLVIPVNP